MTKGKKCTMCDETTTREFHPMKEWKIKGPLCGRCYSKMLHEYYPGEHVRVNDSTTD